MSPSLEPGLLQNPELLETSMSTYYFVAASEAFLTQEEPLEEVLRERVRDYSEKGKEIDFWLVKQPFLKAPELKSKPAGSLSRPLR